MRRAVVGLVFCLHVLVHAESTTSYFSQNGVQWLVAVNNDSECRVVLEEGQPLTQEATSQYDIELDVGALLRNLGNSLPYGALTQDYFDARGAIIVQFGDECFRESTFLHGLKVLQGTVPQKAWVNIEVGKRAFQDCKCLSRIESELPLTRILESAFEGVENLEVFFSDDNREVHFESLTELGKRAFANAGTHETDFKLYMKATSLTSDYLEGSPFQGCYLFSRINIDPGMIADTLANDTLIYESFVELGHRPSEYDCKRVKIVLAEGFKTISSSAFERSCIEVEKWPDSLEEFGEWSVRYTDNWDPFYRSHYCESILPSVLPKNLKVLQATVFQHSSIAGDVAIPDGCSRIGAFCFQDCKGLARLTLPTAVRTVPYGIVEGCTNVSEVVLSPAVTNISNSCFSQCINLTLVVPASVQSIGTGNSGLVVDRYVAPVGTPYPKRVIFEGAPPNGFKNLMNAGEVYVPAEFELAWRPYLSEKTKLAVKVDGVWTALGGSLVSAKIRNGQPNVMDVAYRATSTKSAVKVRMVAFKGGTRSFANATVPATFVADTNGVATAGNVGDAVVPNVEHTVSWEVSSDWGDVKLATISVEVFVLDDELLPLQLMTLPAGETRGKLTFSTNAQSAEKIANALYWLLASREKDLKLENGTLTRTDTNAVLANGTEVNTANALSYIYGKMGYRVLTGAELSEVNRAVRLSLADNAYAVKVEEK